MSDELQQAAATLNGGTRSSTPHLNGGNRCVIALIVYLALFLDNVLLTVIVPILPDYLASLERNSPSSATDVPVPQAMQLALRTTADQHQVYMTKHPIPGKSMVNFTLLHLTTGDNNSSGNNFTDEYNKLAHENGSIGLLLAMKALVQLIFNPIVGNLSVKFGYRLPIVVGTFCLLMSSLVFALGESYWLLLLARAIQGIGSACIGVCGMSLVAQHYPEEARRSKVMGIILGSIALGVLLGYPFGSILYDLIGKAAPFIILSTIIFLNLGLQLLTMDLAVHPEILVVEQQPKWRPLIECKMILAIVVAIWISTSTMAILEPCLPIWLIQYLQPTKWQLGTVFIPDSIGYFVGTNFFGSIAYSYGQVKVSCISLVLVGIASILIPSATTVAQLLMPHFILGLGIGIIDAALVPLLATFVDATLAQEEHNDVGTPGISSYGTVYAIQQTSVSLAYCFAPLIGGEIAQTFGFAWLMRVIGVMNLIYGPILVYLYEKYDPKSLREQHNDLLLKNSGGGGSRYKQLYNSMDME